MKTPWLRAFFLSSCLLAFHSVQAEEPSVTDTSMSTPATNTEAVGKLKIQEIREQDRFGTIEEDRVQAMRTELRYVPKGSSAGYTLITSENSQGKTQNAHQTSDLNIPSWKVFAW